MNIVVRAILSMSRSKPRLVLITLFAWLLLGLVSATDWVAGAKSGKGGDAAVEPSACTTFTPRVEVIPENSNLAAYLAPNFGTRTVSVAVSVPQCGQGSNLEVPSSGTITVTLPSYMSFASATPHPNQGGTITGSGQTVRYDHGRMNDNYPASPAFASVVFTMNVNVPTSANEAPDQPPIGPVGVHSTYSFPTQGSGSVSGSKQVALYYSKMRATSTRKEPAYIGDEIPYTLTTSGYPYFHLNSSIVTITAPAHTEFVAGSYNGTVTGNQLTVDLGTASGAAAINFKLRVLPTLTPTTRFFNPSYQHRLIFQHPTNPNLTMLLSGSLVSNQIVYARPTVEMSWLTQGTAVALNGELPIKARIKNLSATQTLTDVRLASGYSFAGEGLAQLVTPLPTGISLAPGQTQEIEYRLKGTRAGRFTITGEAMARDLADNYRSIPVTSPELCVGCADAELEIVLDKSQYEVGETFVAYARARSNRPEPMTIAFDDPLMDQEASAGSPPEPMLLLEEVAAPPPFTLTPGQPTRSFPVVAQVNRFGVAELVSSFAYTLPGHEPETVEAKRAVSSSPLKVDIQITPTQNVLDLTAPEKKTETCRQLELLPLVKNCIEIVAKVTNTSEQTVTNIHIPNAESPLSLINEIDPRVPGEPLLEIQRQIPDGQVTLGPGEEATWTWRMNAFDAPASLEFAPTVFGVMGGQEIGGHAAKEFEILDNVLLKWGMQPANGTVMTSGSNVRAEGYIENVSADEGGEGKNLRVVVHTKTLRNAGGGFVAPASYNGPTPEKYHVFNLAPEGDTKRIAIRSIFNSLRTEKASSAVVKFEVRLWVVEDDGSLTPAFESALLDDDYLNEYSVVYHPEQIPVDGFRPECLQKYRPGVCAFYDGLFNDAIPGMVGLFQFGMRGLLYASERNARISMIEASTHRATIATILDDEKAKQQMIAELYQEYRELHEQQVLFDQAAGEVPMALEEFTLQTVDSLGRFMEVVDKGDMVAIEEHVGKFLGANPDLALEPFILMRSYLKMNRALREMAEGTADNVYAAAEQAAKRRLDGDVEERIAAAKALPGEPDLAKALLPGDTLTSKLLIEVFGVDQDTVRRIQKIADEAGVIMAFRARSARASELLRKNLAWPKPQALKQKCVNMLDIDYLGYRGDAYGKIEIVEPPSGLRNKEGQALQTALDEHMTLLEASKPELRTNAELRAEVRSRIEIRAQEWTKYNPKLELYNSDFSYVRADVNFDGPFQWARDMVGDIGPKESRRIYRNDVGPRIDPATNEPLRTWEIKMDGPNGQEARHVTGDIDFLGILDLNGNFINDTDKRIAVYAAMVEAQLMEHGESMSARLNKAREEYLECCVFGTGEGMLTIGPWGSPRVGFFVDNRSVMQQMNAAFKRVRGTQVVRDPAGQIVYENGRPKEIILRMEDPSGEFPLINGMPTLRHVDEALVRRFQPTLWETVWQQYFENKVKMYFPNYIKELIEDQNDQNSIASAGETMATFSKGGPVVRLEPVSVIDLKPSDRFEIWTAEAGWASATREQVINAGIPGVVDFAPYSVLREPSSVGSDSLTIAPLSEMEATGDFFAAGDWIVLDPGGPDQETAMIASTSPFRLTAPLKNEHKVGEMIAWVEGPLAGVSVSGRVKTAFDRGIRGAVVTITSVSGAKRTTTTNTLGYFKISDLVPGPGYTVTVVARRYEFAPQSISLTSDLSGLEIVPIE